MYESFIQNLDFQKAKQLIQQNNIQISDDELRYLLPLLKQNPSVLSDKQKRSVLISTLPPSMQQKVNQLLQRFSF